MFVRIVSFSSFPDSSEHAEQNLINWSVFFHKIAENYYGVFKQ